MHLSYIVKFLGLQFAALSAAEQTRRSVPFTEPVQQFPQKIDHSNPSNGTFSQVYQLDTTYFEDGGPILFYQGAEEPLTPLNFTVFADYAAKLGAMVVTLEHR